MPTSYANAAAMETPTPQAREQFERMATFLESPDAMAMGHTEMEDWLSREGRELQRLLLQQHCDLRAEAERKLPRVRGADGKQRQRVRSRSRQLGSRFGSVAVLRLAYEAPGVSSLHPLDAGLNLPPGHYSYGVHRLVAEQTAKSSFDEVVVEVGKWTGATVHKRQVEELAQAAAQDFDAFYAQRRLDVAGLGAKQVLVITSDAKGIVVRPEDLREATRRAAEQEQHKLSKRLTRGEKRNRKRMAQVAATYIVEPFVRDAEDVVREFRPVHEVAERRPKPTDKRVWASVVRDPADVIEEAFCEAERLDPKHRLSWVTLVDGNRDQLRLIQQAARRHRVKVTILLDVVHVLEYLWKAAYCFCPEASREAEAWVTDRLRLLLTGHDPSQVAAGIRRSATRQGLRKKARKAADKCASYLKNNRAYLGYAKALRRGFPIATGVIEGACRYLVKDRMDRTGARWSLAGAEAVLRLRALVTNGDFDEYWRFHLSQEHERNHRARYAQRTIPDPLSHASANRPKLRRIK
ncbi:MAG: ISKra4 family transposase [Polyangiaceae bacterium]|nr:ISKra4 family transposase [Polyangiaceae bacterium]